MPTRHVPDGEHLLIKTNITVDNSEVDKDELATYLKQRPNRKILGLFRFHLGAWNLANSGKPRKYKNWIKRTIGEEPVIFDAYLHDKSSRQLQIYMRNKGFFNATVTDSVVFKLRRDSTPKKKAVAYYHITANAPYKIRQISFSIDDTALVKPIVGAAKQTLLAPGKNYDTDVLADERTRISRDLKNRGYYEFAKEYVFFRVDSTQRKQRVNITIGVKNPRERQVLPNGTDTTISLVHQRFYVNQVYVDPDYKAAAPYANTSSSITAGDLVIYTGGKELQIRPEILQEAVQIKPGELYKLEATERTQNRLATLGVYKFVSIKYTKVGEQDGKQLLDCTIRLTTAPRKSISIESQGTNRGGNLGVSGTVSYKNKNSFKGAEVLELRFTGGLEAQRTQIADESGALQALPFNTLEFGPELRFAFPRLLLPGSVRKPLAAFSPSTKISARYNFQYRPDFERRVASLAYGYAWRNKGNSWFGIDPVDISYVNITTSDAFQQLLDESNNSLLQASYNDHFIVASRLSYRYSDQHRSELRNKRSFNTSIEGAGNALYGISVLANQPLNDAGHYSIFEVQYAQYVKTDVEYIYIDRLNQWSNMAYRSYVGVGVPLENLNVLPFEKSFFAGGANGMRAWRARTLGPGGLIDTAATRIDQIGDIQLEGQAEYRFDVVRMLEGAVFADAGNVWLLRKDEQRPLGEWQWDRFYKEIALDVGLGARFDFDFFIIRLDAGLQFKDPRLPEGERWIWQDKDTYNSLKRDLDPGYDGYRPGLTLNLGIGYPFY